MEETITWEDLPRLMAEVHTRACALLKGERYTASLQATELINTAIRRLAPAGGDWSEVTWENRDHFYATLYRAMENALVSHARRRMAQKRAVQQTVRLEDLRLHDLPSAVAETPEQLIALKEALEQLEQTRPEWATVVKDRFLGLTIPEIAQVRSVSESTVRRALTQGRRWYEEEILRRLNAAEGPCSEDAQAS